MGRVQTQPTNTTMPVIPARAADISVLEDPATITRFFKHAALQKVTGNPIFGVGSTRQDIKVPGVGLLAEIILRLNYDILVNLPASPNALAWSTDGDRKLIAGITFQGTDGVTRFDNVPSHAFDCLDQFSTWVGSDQAFSTVVNNAMSPGIYTKPSLALQGSYNTPFHVYGTVEYRLPFQKRYGDPRGILRTQTGNDTDASQFFIQLNVGAGNSLVGDDSMPIQQANGSPTAVLSAIQITPIFHRYQVMPPMDGGGEIVEPTASFGIVQEVEYLTDVLVGGAYNYHQLRGKKAVSQIIQFLYQSGQQSLGAVVISPPSSSPIQNVHVQYGSVVSPILLPLTEFVSDMHRDTERQFSFVGHDYRDDPLETDRIPNLYFGFDCDNTLLTAGNSKLVTVQRNFRRALDEG